MNGVVMSGDVKGTTRTVIQMRLQFLFNVGQKTPRLQCFALKLEEETPELYSVPVLSPYVTCAENARK